MQSSMERSILGIKKKDKMRTEVIKKKLEANKDFLETVKMQKWGGLACARV